MQYRAYYVTVTNDSNIVLGHPDTKFLTNVSEGNSFKVEGDSVIYQVSSIVSDTQLYLSTNFKGATNPVAQYQITTDYTPLFGLAEINASDRDWAQHLTQETIRKIDSILGGMATGWVPKGGWDADTNTPLLPAASSSNVGWIYKVAVSGNTEIDEISEWFVGDSVLSNGSAWFRIPGPDIAAETAAVNAAGSAAAALASENAAADSETNAAASEAAAAASAAAALVSENAAADSETNAAASEAVVAIATTNVAASEAAAAASAAAALVSENAAADSETNAAASEAAALGYRNSSQTYAEAASVDAGNASEAASEAATSALEALDYKLDVANNTSIVIDKLEEMNTLADSVEAWETASAASALAAAASQSAAAISESNAADSEAEATSQAGIATAAATAAATSFDDAATAAALSEAALSSAAAAASAAADSAAAAAASAESAADVVPIASTTVAGKVKVDGTSIVISGGGVISSSISSVESIPQDTTHRFVSDDQISEWDAKLDEDRIGVTVQPYNVNIQEHISDTDNPHEVTSEQIGLGNVVDKTQQVLHGFGNAPALPSFSGNTFTLPGSTPYTMYINGVPSVISTDKTVTISSPALGTQYFITMDADYNLQASTTGFSLLDLTNTPVVTAYYNESGDWILGKEWHQAARNLIEHKDWHEAYGTKYISGFTSLTCGDGEENNSTNTFSISGGEISDEGLRSVISGTQTQMRIGYRNSSNSNRLKFDAASTAYTKLNPTGDVPYYDNNGVLTNLENDYFTNIWIYVTNRLDTPIVGILGQGQSDTLGGALAQPNPALTGLSVAEWKLLYRITIKSIEGALAWQQNEALYATSTGPAINAGASATVSAGVVSFSAAGNINASNVQAALEELDTEKSSVTHNHSGVYLGASDVYAWAKAATKPAYTAAEVGLGNVDNTADSTKNVLSATKLTTPRTINGVSFDGSANITINAVDSTAREAAISAGTTAQYWRGDKTWQALPTSLPASDVYSWAKAATKPVYTYSEVGAAAASHSHDYAAHRAEGTNFIDYAWAVYDAYQGGWRVSSDLQVAYAYNSGSAASCSGNSATVTINYNNDSNSTYQMLWGFGNGVYGTAGIFCNPYSDTIYAVGNIVAYYSDERLKTKLGKLESALDKVTALEGFLYTPNELAQSLGYRDLKVRAGLSAQGVQRNMPELVDLAPVDTIINEETGEKESKSGESYLTVDYANLVPYLVEAIKELKQQIRELKVQSGGAQ